MTTTRKWITGSLLGLSLAITGISIAQPEHDVSARRHPNIAAAQRLVDQAFNRHLRRATRQ